MTLKKNSRVLILGLIFLILGILRYQISQPKIDQNHIAFYNNKNLTFAGTILDEPDIRINHIKYTLGDLEVSGQKIKGKVLLTNTLYPQFQYGERLKVRCEFKKPEPFEDFDYARYLARSGIYSVCSFAQIEVVEKKLGNYFFSKIFQFKKKLVSLVNVNLPEPAASLFNGMVFGSRQGIPKELNEKFNITSTSHLIAISGLNIAIIITLLTGLAMNLYISRKKAFWLITLFLIIYLILIGAPASAVRAGIMGWLVILAMQLGRLNKATNLLIFAAALMLLQNPKILRDDAGFQLSFLATLGLIYFYPLMENWFGRLPKTFGIKDVLQMSLAAQFATVPLVVYNFGRLSLVSPLTNVLVVSLMPYLLIFGAIALPVAALVSVLGKFIFFPVWLILAYIVRVVEIFAALPLAALNFEKKSVLVLIFLSIIIILGYLKLTRIQKIVGNKMSNN